MFRAGRKLAFQIQSWGKRADITSGTKILFAAARALLCLALIANAAPAADPESAPPDPVKILALQIANAATDQERAALIAQANPAWLKDHSLRKQLVQQVYQRSVEGDYVKAEALSHFGLRFVTEQYDEEGIAAMKTQLAGSLREFGDLAEASALLQEALTYYETSAPDSRGLVATYQALAIVNLYRSDFSRALASVHQALTAAQRLGYREGIIPALNTTGEIYRAQGQPERALEFYERARKEVGDDGAWNMAFIFNNIGQSYEALGDTTKALDFVNRARAVAEKVKMPPRVATSLAVIGNLHLVRHEIAAARESYAQSLVLSLELRDRASEARARLGLANCAWSAGDFQTALEQAQHAGDLSRAAGQRTQRAAAQTLAGRSLRALQRSDEASAAFEAAIAEIEHVRTEVAGGAMESESFFATQVAPYEEMVSMLVAAQRHPEALAMAERASSRTLLEIVASGKPDVEGSMNDAERARAHGLSRDIAELNRAVKQARGLPEPNEQQIVALEADLTHAREAHENFQAELLALHPDWKRTVSSAQPATIDEINQLAHDRTRAFLKFVSTERETFLFVLHERDTGPALQVFTLKLAGEQLAQRVAEFREKLASRSLGWQEPAGQLYDLLLKDSATIWDDAEQIVIVPDGPLWELPFQALRMDGSCLIQHRAISYAPSLSFLNRSDTRPPLDPSNLSLLAVGNPALGEGAHRQWPPLPATGRELADLKKIYGADRSCLLLEEGAREDIFKREAETFDILHFATHGVLNDQAPMYSYLLFAQTNLASGEDGLLEARELMQMNLHARLAVLSACETARGRISAGEGVIGLSWAFLVAGCPATVVSQWKVDSESNADLMASFHRQLHAGTPPAEALRAASLELAQRPEYRHPFYWAPFVLVGDSR